MKAVLYHAIESKVFQTLRTIPDLDLLLLTSQIEEFYQLCMTYQPDILFVEISIREITVFDTVLAVKKMIPGVKAIVLAVDDDSLRSLKTNRSGVDGIVRSDLSCEEFQQIIQYCRKDYCIYQETVNNC